MRTPAALGLVHGPQLLRWHRSVGVLLYPDFLENRTRQAGWHCCNAAMFGGLALMSPRIDGVLHCLWMQPGAADNTQFRLFCGMHTSPGTGALSVAHGRRSLLHRGRVEDLALCFKAPSSALKP